MDLDQIVNDVLNHLFNGYIQNGGTPIFNASEIISNHGEDPNEIGQYLVDHGWVKNQQFRPDSFYASISMLGINKIKPEFISENRDRIITSLGESGNVRQGIMEILEYEPSDFQIAHQLAKEFEREGIIEAQYQHNNVIIKLTLEGRNEYEKE